MAKRVPRYPNQLRACIKEAGYTLKEVSEESNIPLRTLCDYVSGYTRIPHASREPLARIIGCSVEALAPQRGEAIKKPSQEERQCLC